jgi:serine/threonine protein kinase
MDKIGKYHLLRKLGEGATSDVFLSFDPKTERDLAIKIAKTKTFQDPNYGFFYRKVFETEASLAGKLDHPYIVAIHDSEFNENEAYIVMDFVQGGTLEKYCVTDNLLRVDRIVDIMSWCALALEFTSRGGIIHRDIKPANILLIGDKEDVKIADFGGAIVPGVEPLEGIGSPSYMSPEQARQDPLDFHTDMYSLGIVMYQLLTGRLPFHGENIDALLENVINAPMKPPSDFRLDITDRVQAIVMRATAKKKEDRYKSWESFSIALAKAQ